MTALVTEDIAPVLNFQIPADGVAKSLRSASRLRLLLLGAASALGLLGYFLI